MGLYMIRPIGSSIKDTESASNRPGSLHLAELSPLCHNSVIFQIRVLKLIVLGLGTNPLLGGKPPLAP